MTFVIVILILLGLLCTIRSYPRYAQFIVLWGTATLALVFYLFHGIPPLAHLVFWLCWLVAFLVAIKESIDPRQALKASYATLVIAALIGVYSVFAQMTPVTPTATATAFPGYDVSTVSKLLQSGDAPKGTCDKVKYYAYEAPAGSHNFGPNLALVNPTDVNEAVALFYQFVSCDPLAAATNEEFIRSGENLDPGTATANAVKYNNDATRTEWAAAVNRMRDRTATYYLVNADGIHYDSIGMIPGANPDVMPTLTKFSEQPNLGLTLVLVDKDGHESAFRIWCHIQPAVKQFTKVTPAPAAPQPAPPLSPGTPPKPKGNGTPSTTPPSTTKPPSSTTTTKPPSSTTTTKPPSSTTTPPSSTTTPPSSTTTPPSSTTTPPSTTTTPPSTTTTPPVTTTNTKSPDPSDWPHDTDKPTVSSPPGSPEPTLPPETNPVDPSQTPGAEVTATDLPAPSVEVPPPTSRDIPTPEPTMAPPPQDPGTSIQEPAPPAPAAPLAPEGDAGNHVPQDLPAPPASQESEAPAPAPQPAPLEPAPVVPAPADTPAPQAPVGPAESAPPVDNNSVPDAGGTSTNPLFNGSPLNSGGASPLGALPGAMMLLLPWGFWYRRKKDKLDKLS